MSPRNELTELLLGREVTVRFVTMREAIALHDDSIGRAGGALGVRDAGLLESAIHRPISALLYEEMTDLHELAAELAEAIIQNHAFLDGNKRTAFNACLLFLEKNGVEFEPDSPEATEVFRRLANHELSASEVAAWIKDMLNVTASWDMTRT